MNPDYIIVTMRRPKPTDLNRKPYHVMRLALANENATHPNYHPVLFNRAKGPYTHEEAVQVINSLRERDRMSGGNLRAQAERAGLGPVPEHSTGEVNAVQRAVASTVEDSWPCGMHGRMYCIPCKERRDASKG